MKNVTRQSPGFFQSPWCGLTWSDWIPLDSPLADFRAIIPNTAGFYRVRSPSIPVLCYVGQTGRNLRERTRALSGNAHRSANDPPYNDPHTAAPALWAYRIEDDFTYEISAAAADLDFANRQCMEDLLLAEHRMEAGASTLCNHGRFHARWTRPTNRSRGQAMRRLSRNESNLAAGPSLPPPIGSGPPEGRRWLGLEWSPNFKLDRVYSEVPNSPGVYRLRTVVKKVVYLGESKFLVKRLVSHARNYARSELQASFVAMPGALEHHLRERETDLVGAFYKVHKHPPKFQYRRKDR